MRALIEIGRYEYKYVVPVSRRREIRSALAPFTRPDDHARPLEGGGHGYLVHTLYLDTPALTDYFERLAEHRVRNRVRIRTYGARTEAQPVFLENKRKSDRYVIKHRVVVGRADSWHHGDQPVPWQDLPHSNGREHYAARCIASLIEQGSRQPVTTVHYAREVFVPRELGERPVRINMDLNVTASSVSSLDDLFLPGAVSLIPADWMVVELKLEGRPPSWLLELRKKLGSVAVPVSKFGLSVACTIRRHHPSELRHLTPPSLSHLGVSA